MTEDSERTDPVSALAKRIRKAEAPVDEGKVVNWAMNLDVDFTRDEELRRLLSRAQPNIRYSRVKGAYSWVDDDPPRSVPKSPFAEWARANQADRAELADSIRKQVDGRDDSDGELQLARALGITRGKTDWNRVVVDDATDQAIVEALAKSADPDWLMSLVTVRDSPTATKRLKALPATDRSELAAAAFSRLAGETEGLKKEHAGAIRRVARVAGSDATPAFDRAAVRLIRTCLEAPDPTVVSSLTTVVTGADITMIASAIDEHFDRADLVGSWLTVLAKDQFRAEHRCKLLRSVAASRHRRSLYEPGVFAALSLRELGELLSTIEISPLVDGLAQHLIEPVRTAAPSQFGSVLGAISEFPVLEQLAPVELLQQLVSRDEASARVARESVRPLIDRAGDLERERFAPELAAALAERDSARERAIEAEAQRDTTSAELSSLDEQRRSALSESANASTAELRQAQIDALRAWIEDLEAVRDVAATLDHPGVLKDHLNHSGKRLAEFGVEVIGVPGQRMAYDTAIHGDANIEPGATVEVLAPAYRLENVVTPLRYGRVRVVDDVER